MDVWFQKHIVCTNQRDSVVTLELFLLLPKHNLSEYWGSNLLLANRKVSHFLFTALLRPMFFSLGIEPFVAN